MAEQGLVPLTMRDGWLVGWLVILGVTSCGHVPP